MKVVVVISDREAIPVRAIPFVTGWLMSPDIVAKALARTDHFRRFRKLTAYLLKDGGGYAPIPPKEWDGTVAELKALSDGLAVEEKTDSVSYSRWRRESIPRLPEGVFVWKDEFESAFLREYAPKGMSLGHERPNRSEIDWEYADGSGALTELGDERAHERELNPEPMVPKALRKAVLEGFPVSAARNGRAKKSKDVTSPGTTERNTLLVIIAALCKQCGIEYTKRGAANQIARWTQAFGADVSDDTVRRVLGKISEAVDSRTK